MEISQKSRSSAFFGHLQVQKEGNTGPLKTSLGRGLGQLSASVRTTSRPSALPLPLPLMLDGDPAPLQPRAFHPERAVRVARAGTGLEDTQQDSPLLPGLC